MRKALPKVALAITTRDEASLLQQNIRYHLQRGFRTILVTDNRSSDATSEILSNYELMGYVIPIFEPVQDYALWWWRTRMARLAAKLRAADWIVHCDTDEFLWIETGGIAELLAGVPDEIGIVNFSRLNFLACSDDPKPTVQSMTVRRKDGATRPGKVVLPKIAHRTNPDVIVGHGGHGLLHPKLKSADAPAGNGFFHYQTRSWEEFERNIKQCGEGYELNDLPPEFGKRKRLLYQAYLNGKLRPFYEEELMPVDERERGLADGQLIEDQRLRKFFDTIPADFPKGKWLARWRRQEKKRSALLDELDAQRPPYPG